MLGLTNRGLVRDANEFRYRMGKTQDLVLATAVVAKNRAGQILGHRNADISRAELPFKHIFYRSRDFVVGVFLEHNESRFGQIAVGSAAVVATGHPADQVAAGVQLMELPKRMDQNVPAALKQRIDSLFVQGLP